MKKRPNTRVRNHHLHVKKNDMVQILSGENGGSVKNENGRGMRGRVTSVDSMTGKIMVEGANTAFKHRKVYTDRQGQRQGGRTEINLPFPASKVMVVCPSCDLATRIRIKIEKIPAGEKTVVRRSRICQRCGAALS